MTQNFIPFDSHPALNNEAVRIREDIYRALYRMRCKLLIPGAIYLGHKWMVALDDLNRRKSGIYGERIKTFCDIPVYEVVGEPYHFCIAAKEIER